MTAGKRLDFLLTANGDTEELVTTTDVLLDGKSYQARAQYRPWDDAWMLSLYTPSGTAIVEGALANDGEDVLSNVVHPNRPPGRLLVKDTLGSLRNPGSKDWRSGVWLVYVPLAGAS